MNNQPNKNQQYLKLRYAKNALSEETLNLAIQDIISGSITYRQAEIMYPGLSKSTLHKRVKKYLNSPSGIPPLLETNSDPLEPVQLSTRIRELEKALELANLKVSGLETMINIAEDQLKINIRKKSGSKR